MCGLPVWVGYLSGFGVGFVIGFVLIIGLRFTFAVCG